MALTQITTLGIADSAITQSKLDASVPLGGPKITAVEVTNSTYTVLDDTAVALEGGYIKITGSGFVSGARVLVDSTSATSVQFISSTVIRAELPAKTAGSYVVYLVNPDGGVAISVNGVTYSGLPNWTTTSTLTEGKNSVPISIQLAAIDATTFTLAAGSTLPTGLALSSSGLLSGTVSGVTVSTVYTFSIVATDAEFQDSPRTFSLTIKPAVLTIFSANSASPFIYAYQFSDSGFGTKYADPATTPTGSAYDVDVTTESDVVIVAHSTSPYITAYPWISSGFGTKYANPSVLPPANNGEGQSISISPNSNIVALAHSAEPFVDINYFSIYLWNSTSGFGTKFAIPWTNMYGVISARFSSDGQTLALGNTGSPYIHAFAISTSGLGSKYSSPSTVPSNAIYGIRFSPNNSYIATAHFAEPYLSVYPWNSTTGFGTKYANPSTLPTGTGRSVDFSPDNSVIALAHSISPAVSVYQWSASGFGTKYSDPTTLGTNYTEGVKFSPDGSAIALAGQGISYPTVLRWNNTTGFGTKYADPATGATGTTRKVAFAN